MAAPRSIVGHWLATREIQQVRLRRKIALPPLGALHHADETSRAIATFIDILKHPAASASR